MTHQQTLFDTGEKNTAEVARLEERRHSKPAGPPEPGPPPKQQRESECHGILEALKMAEEVSSARLMEISPCGYRQRVSDLRKDGYDIECRRIGGTRGGLYTLKNRENRGKKYQ